MLFATTAGSLVLLLSWPKFFVISTCNILLLWGIFVTSVTGLTILIFRMIKISPVFLIISLGAAELTLLDKIDSQFRIVVQDVDGKPVDIEAREMALHNHPSSYLDNYYWKEGIKEGDGEFYFGLLVWLRNKGDWRFPGKFHDPDRNLLGDLEWTPAKWSEWPKRVIVE